MWVIHFQTDPASAAASALVQPSCPIQSFCAEQGLPLLDQTGAIR